MIFTEEDTIVGNLTDSKVSFLKAGKTIEFVETRDDFQKKELAHFLNLVENNIVEKDLY